MSSQSKPAPLVSRLKAIVTEGEALAERPGLASITVEVWVMKLRDLLSQTYGDNSREYASCPPPGQDDPSLAHQDRIRQRLPIARRLLAGLERTVPGKRIFIGHGRSLQWLRLKDFMTTQVKLEADEFNVEPTAGIHTTDRLATMLSQAGMAFLVMTAEDQHADGTLHARSNVIHEVGLFQGHLGSRRAIVMVEQNCSTFSNLDGLTVIQFPLSDIAARFEDVRQVLVREGLLLQR